MDIEEGSYVYLNDNGELPEKFNYLIAKVLSNHEHGIGSYLSRGVNFVRLFLFNRTSFTERKNVSTFQFDSRTLCYGKVDPERVAEILLKPIKTLAIVECIVKYLLVKSANGQDVINVSASGNALPSSLYTFAPQSLLEPGTDSCWISQRQIVNTFKEKQPFEDMWVMFEFDNIVRVQSFSVRIPRLPNGPLSVRTFVLATSIDGKEFEISPRKYTTHDTDHIQHFCCDLPMEAKFVKMICLTAADSDSDSVGLWEVQFNSAASSQV